MLRLFRRSTHTHKHKHATHAQHKTHTHTQTHKHTSPKRPIADHPVPWWSALARLGTLVSRPRTQCPSPPFMASGMFCAWPHTTRRHTHTHTYILACTTQTHAHTHTLPNSNTISCLPNLSHFNFAFLMCLVGRSWHVGISGPLIFTLIRSLQITFRPMPQPPSWPSVRLTQTLLSPGEEAWNVSGASLSCKRFEASPAGLKHRDPFWGFTFMKLIIKTDGKRTFFDVS